MAWYLADRVGKRRGAVALRSGAAAGARRCGAAAAGHVRDGGGPRPGGIWRCCARWRAWPRTGTSG
ncbi:hypothetical protein [Streptomyces sp. DHE17-7]|uniref:hypothetical protein n=1 Tax=Streptomyces sp. DHE17-7 TaxID=2759949 RepID=UPI003FA6D7AE